MTPFSVLHVCMGNICRSSMAERLLVLALPESHRESVYSHSAGTIGRRAGEPMSEGAARQLLTRGGDVTGFKVRKLHGSHIEASDLILAATSEHYDQVIEMRPDAEARTFVLGEFGRLLASFPTAGLPPFSGDAESLYVRGVALVTALDALRAGARPKPGDDLDDPWGLDEETFIRVADEIESTLRPLARVLVPAGS